ncbi:MAG TPA: HDOD domain-containing protein [Rhodocyclaceae bacterium]|nr:HDOD domain-containing protein [Rhodocyclaceae bacterium]
MFKWLEKVISGSPADKTAPAAADNAAPPVRPRSGNPAEPPLPAPVIHLDQGEQDELFKHGILSRQVIVDRSYHPVAYEFGLRTESTQRNIATAQILAGVLGRLGDTELNAGRQTWLRLNDVEITEALVRSLDPTHPVLAVELTTTDRQAGDTALANARLLKAEGFRLALADWKDTTLHHAWLPLCDYVEVRNASHNPIELGSWPEKLQILSPQVRLVACDVDSWEVLEFCHRQNFHLFRGQFLTHRENWPRQPKISPERTRLIDLLNRLHLGAEITEIADQLKQSPELSYRLLRYINSAGVGTNVRIGSIHQGLMVLGRDKIYRWLTVLLFTSGQAQSLDNALLEQALMRARLMELLAGERFSRVQVDEMFVIGIFSLLDMLLRMPMSVALEPLKLPHAVETTLLNADETASEYSPFLNLAIACEESDRERLKQLAAQLAIPLPIINSLHLDALVWTQKTLMEK